MKKFILVINIFFIFISQLKASEFLENDEIKHIFKGKNINGTLVIYDLKKDVFIGYNRERAEQEFYPASTFKIFSSLIGLETESVMNVDEVFYKYDGKKVFLKSWAKDSSLRYAIKVSQVPAYKELAKKIGLKLMKENIEKLNYGNKNIGTKVDSFWLHGPLKISAFEQIDLLTLLAQKKLSYNIKHQEEISDITILEKGKDYVLHGKTGWATNNIEIPIGWFVGWLETSDNIFIFATNIDNSTAELLPKREEIERESFKKLNILN
ncbi:class D beta-lactamase [Fusobacterium sp.]|uniref:class D beta-lactamase n=1 Tax=Fusobacterium sp. TaxID=68766 RepID=UPI002901EF16|nr:class D beta-lactamase [Fusobacterium sp.]MDU1911569.1 class D beta-lactamase [Fusobacterium sp.]